ncbi:hypothetical protein [Kocuria sp.]|uniref:hypothetical protein n=1 Tax=Kocuria sp. TaxID=1871328 RepID=UPI0028983B32|nr:hypothetical protein [Kocuria sp.]
MATTRKFSASDRGASQQTTVKIDSTTRTGKVITYSAKQQQQLLRQSKKLQKVLDERKKELGVA